jgi:putative DNA primase/helicase
VLFATEEYLEDEDSFGQWAIEFVSHCEYGHEKVADLFASWKRWAEAAGLDAGSQKHFTGNMKARGFVAKREGGTGRCGFVGIRLQRPDYTEDARYGG